VALAMPKHGELTLASRTVMQLVKEIGQGTGKVRRARGAAGSPRRVNR